MFMYSHALRANIPYYWPDETGAQVLNYATMTFKVFEGKVDKRKVKKAIRWWVRTKLERTLHSRELYEIMKRLREIDPY